MQIKRDETMHEYQRCKSSEDPYFQLAGVYVSGALKVVVSYPCKPE
jgi:hypothetical protein